MARQNSKGRGGELQKPPQRRPLIRDESPELGDGIESGEPLEKDETELALEKAVFGDDEGFKEGLRLHMHEQNGMSSSADSVHEAKQEVDEEEEGLEGLDDADLFFVDSGSSTKPHDLAMSGIHTTKNEAIHQGDAPAWEDSDDERITVSLASNPRLRKLRHAETDDVVNGMEYMRRLREQFERLYPVPEWANPSASKVNGGKKKRRRPSGTGSTSDEAEFADDTSIDSESLSAQPLARLLQNVNSLNHQPAAQSSTGKKLRPEVIDIQRLKDVGATQPSAITSLSFHPVHPLLLSSGPASTIYLHHLSPAAPSPNPLITSLHIRSSPLTTAALQPPTGSKIFFSSRRRYFHIWDLATGKISKISRIYGHEDEQRSMERFKLSKCGRWMGLVGSARKGGGVVNVLEASTCQWVAQVRVEGKGGVADFDWWGNGEGMTVFGKAGEAVEWSLREQKVVARWIDEGAVGITVVTLGGTRNNNNKTNNAPLGPDRWIAVGSQSGIVNIYDRTTWLTPPTKTKTSTSIPTLTLPTRPKPLKSFDQLTTPISHLHFSPNAHLLLMASRWKRDALRLVHLPSCTVYRNWPTSSTPLGRISAVAFSARGDDMFAVGNEQGRLRLWEVRG